MNKKPIYAIHFCSSNPKYTISGTGLCPVKANDEEEAKSKFLKKYISTSRLTQIRSLLLKDGSEK